MRSREYLQEKLEELLGSRNVYFQPPESFKMNYPAIVYSRDRLYNRQANNGSYNQLDSYIITYIDKDPDSDMVRKLSLLPYCRHEQHFNKDNLNHDIFIINFIKGDIENG